MAKIYGFQFEGENIDGDIISYYAEFEECESKKDAFHWAEKSAEETLKEEDGGHIDIFDKDGVFMGDVEV